MLQNMIKNASEISRIRFHFVIKFYCLCDICIFLCTFVRTLF